MIPDLARQRLEAAIARNPTAKEVRVRISGQPVYIAKQQADGTFHFHEAPPVASTPPHGPGTELKRLLASAGLEASPGCRCDAMAAEMNRLGPDWCLANEDKIIAVMEREARRRQLPFMRLVASQLIRLAVRRARSRPQIAPGPPIDIPLRA